VVREGRRICVIQHGDYAQGLKVWRDDAPEPYFGMKQCVAALEAMFGDDERLIVSLEAPAPAPAPGSGEIRDGRATLVGAPDVLPGGLIGGLLKWPIPLRGSLRQWQRARRILQRVDAFNPTHLVLRTAGQLAWHILDHLAPRRLPTLVIFASVFQYDGPASKWWMPRLVQRLNEPHVLTIANHRTPATRSMQRFGVEASKCVAFDYAGYRRPEDEAPKARGSAPPHTLIYAGTISQLKGAGDVVDAVEAMRVGGRAVRLTLAGEGPLRGPLQQRVAASDCLRGAVELPGVVKNEQVYALMRGADLVVVPSRHEFQEGMPLTLTEALASRTPVLLSDHPLFKEVFVDGQGVRFFRAGDPHDLARVAGAVLDDAEGYAKLSQTTAQAFTRLGGGVLFADVVRQWSARCG
jgi:glycosyltransferase involved in cell wall biosynthesis